MNLLPRHSSVVAGVCKTHGAYEGPKCPTCLAALRQAQDAAGIVRKGGQAPESLATGTCVKRRYPNKRAAEDAAMKYALKDWRRFGRARVNTAYLCHDCRMWHRTSKVNGK